MNTLKAKGRTPLWPGYPPQQPDSTQRFAFVPNNHSLPRHNVNPCCAKPTHTHATHAIKLPLATANHLPTRPLLLVTRT